MSEFERKKIISNKNRLFNKDANSSGSATRSGRGGASGGKGKDSSSVEVKQPTILLKSKVEPSADESLSVAKKSVKDSDTVSSPHAIKETHDVSVPVVKHMKKSMKFIEDKLINVEHLEDYLQDNTDFIVVGVVGPQGVGKSTILNMLSENKVAHNLKESLLFKRGLNSTEDFLNGLTHKLENIHIDDKHVFKVQSQEVIENCTNATQEIDVYVSRNRVIFLDCQPILAVGVLDELVESENKRDVLFSDFVPLENSAEIQGLQYTAFLMSVCHVMLVVQDWFFDSNVVRFIQTAEMLRPTMDEFHEYFPHLVMVQNRAQIADFTPERFRAMQKVYDKIFEKTKLQFHSNLGLGSGRIINTLNRENCGNQVNLFLIPEITGDCIEMQYGHPPVEDLIKRLRANLFGAPKSALTHVQLTEKTWLVYCNKVWETLRKSPFFLEYTKLMP